MNLKKIKPISSRGNSLETYVSINKSGSFSFSKPCLKELNMEGNKRVDFFQDIEDSQNWYIAINDSGELKLRYYGDEKGPMVSSSSIAKQIKKSTKNDPDKTLRAKIGAPIKYGDGIVYPLLIENGSYFYRT